MNKKNLSGVFAAVITPLTTDHKFDRDSFPQILRFVLERGCHGALMLGTTGEGPSFSPDERFEIFQAGLEFRKENPSFRLFAGTGTPSLEDTIYLTRKAFDMGIDGVVVLPPYYYRTAPEEGIFHWFSEILHRAVPSDGVFLGYHIPRISGVPLSVDLIKKLKDKFPINFAGIKDSSADLNQAERFGRIFGYDLLLYNGTDRLFTKALQSGASGCITAMANIASPDLRKVWNMHKEGKTAPVAQSRLNAARDVFDQFPPAAPLIKALLTEIHGFPKWAVKPPLQPFKPEIVDKAVLTWRTQGKIT